MIDFFIKQFRGFIKFLYIVCLIGGSITGGIFFAWIDYTIIGVFLGFIGGYIICLLIITPCVLLFEMYTKVSSIDSKIQNNLITKPMFVEMYSKISSIESLIKNKQNSQTTNTEEQYTDTAASENISQSGDKVSD